MSDSFPSPRFNNFHGRVGRMVFWLVGVLPMGLIGWAAWEVDDLLGLDGWLLRVSITLWVFPFLLVLVKRWHDRNRSGWFVLVGLIPVVGQVWTLVECGFLPGVEFGDGRNRYGVTPGSKPPRVVESDKLELISGRLPQESTKLTEVIRRPDEGSGMKEEEGPTDVIRKKKPEPPRVFWVLEVESSSLQGQKLVLTGEEWDGVEELTVGRKDGCHWKLRDQSVSRCHAGLLWDRGRLGIVDRGSTAGVFLNRKLMVPHQITSLRDGDRVILGDIHLIVRRQAHPS